VAAREDQAQPIIGDGHLVLGAAARFDRRKLRLDRRFAPELCGLVAQAPTTAQPIDRPVPGRGGDPRTGIRRDASVGPDLERGDEGVLDGLLREVEVAQDPDERRDRPSLLLAEQAVDDLVSGGVRPAQPAAAPTDWSADSDG
jgi:hypothetical protein